MMLPDTTEKETCCFSACYAELLLAPAFIIQACVALHTRPVLHFFFFTLSHRAFIYRQRSAAL